MDSQQKWQAWRTRNDGWVDMLALLCLGAAVWIVTAAIAIMIGRYILHV
jgi:hypothetical protein